MDNNHKTVPLTSKISSGIRQANKCQNLYVNKKLPESIYFTYYINY